MGDYIYHKAAAQPPPGVQSNFDSPHGNPMVANAVVGVACVSVTVFAWTRLYIKIRIIHKLHPEDCKQAHTTLDAHSLTGGCRSNTYRLGRSTCRKSHSSIVNNM
jgi:hypothetical protein